MPQDDLNDFLNGIETELNAGRKTRDGALERYESERQEFLKTFYAIAERGIVPTFRKAERSTEAISIRYEKRHDTHELSVRLETGSRISSGVNSGYLRYRPDVSRQQIFREINIDHRPEAAEMKAVTANELTPEQITLSIKSLVNAVNKWP